MLEYSHKKFKVSNSFEETDPIFFHAQKIVLQNFKKIAISIPAYKNFLKKNNINYKKINTFKDFVQFVPVTDKNNYIRKYPLADLSWPGTRVGGSFIYTSSGTTGEPSFWKRNAVHDKAAASFHAQILEKFFHIKKTKTLILDCFAMGSHVAGFITATSILDIAKENKYLSIITPGSKKEEILKILSYLSGEFEQVILAGYPPFIKDLFINENSLNTKLNCKKIGFLFAAQGFTESWRQHLADRVGLDKYVGSINIYGSADVGPMAFETPLTIRMRNEIEEKKRHIDFQLENIGPGVAPYLFQYDPRKIFLEAVDNEIIVTADNGIPLVRYNIHDIGGLSTYNHLINKFKVNDLKSNLKLPFAYIFGRSNYAVVFYGANVYPENIQTILSEAKIQNLFTGKFLLKIIENKNYEQFLNLDIELSRKNSKKNLKEIQKLSNFIIIQLMGINKEFSVVAKDMGKASNVKINFFNHGLGNFLNSGPKLRPI